MSDPGILMNPGILMMLPLLIATIPTTVQAGPSCEVRPNHPNCEPGNSGSSPVYKVTFSNIRTGTELKLGIYTTPGTLDGDESGLNANSNGPNEVKLQLNDGSADNFLREAFGIDGQGISVADSCFPIGHRLNGSIQMTDNVNSGGDANRLGYIWVHAFTREGEEIQYAIDLFDYDNSWSVPLLPKSIGDTATREVTHWESRVTKKKFKTGCETGGLVATSANEIIITIERVISNPWYP